MLRVKRSGLKPRAPPRALMKEGGGSDRGDGRADALHALRQNSFAAVWVAGGLGSVHTMQGNLLMWA